MKKINIQIYEDNNLRQEYRDINALIKEDEYTFTIDKVLTKLSNKIIYRSNDEFEFNLDIERKTCAYLLKGYSTFDIEVEKIVHEEDSGVWEYKISSNEKTIKIVITS